MDNIRDVNTLIFCSFRYALGRRSYIVFDVVDLITKHYHNLYYQTKELIHKEIIAAIKQDEAGMEMDVKEWRKILILYLDEQLVRN